LTKGIDEVVLIVQDKTTTVKKSVLCKIPYFQALLSPYWEKPGDIKVDTIELSLLHTILAYVESGKMRHLLKKLPRSQNVANLLCAMDYLNLPLFPTIDLDKIKKDMKNLHNEEDKYGIISCADKNGALDAAAVLCVAIQIGKIRLQDGKIKSIVYGLVEFTLSHPKTFGPRLRYHMFQTAKKCPFTLKQHGLLEGWQNKWTRTAAIDSSSSSDVSFEKHDDYSGSSDS